jgi:hypothetical protein
MISRRGVLGGALLCSCHGLAARPIRLKPFMSIGDETYRLYNPLRES